MSTRLVDTSDWRRLAASAHEIRVAGAAIDLSIQSNLSDLPLTDALRKRLKNGLAKALRSELGDRYDLESLKSANGAFEVRVSGNTPYPSPRTLLFSSRRPNWKVEVDSAVESMRRVALEICRASIDDQIELSASWMPGHMVFAEESSLAEDAPVAAIQDTLRQLGDRKTRLEAARLILLLLAVALGIGGGVAALFTRSPWIPIYLFAYAFLLLVLLPLFNGRLVQVRGEIAELKERLELRGLLDDEERRAFRLFQLHNLDLKRYYDLALTQRRFIFGLGVFCIVLGAGIAVTALVMLSDSSASDQEKFFIAGVGGIGTILTNFVAVVYLRMFRDTVNSMDTFHNRLVATHHLLFGNLLAARIEDKAKRDATLAAMASSVTGIDTRAQEMASGQRGNGTPQADSATRS